jgi:hypothetical protein
MKRYKPHFQESTIDSILAYKVITNALSDKTDKTNIKDIIFFYDKKDKILLKNKFESGSINKDSIESKAYTTYMPGVKLKDFSDWLEEQGAKKVVTIQQYRK